MITIRPEQPADKAAVYQINAAAFARDDEANLVEALRTGNNITLSLVAEISGRVVGHILFTLVTIENQGATFAGVALGPVAVFPDYQRQGVGSRLIQAGLTMLEAAGHGCCLVLGHADYYPRFGFVQAGRFGLRSTFNIPDDVFMALELQPGYLSDKQGLVKYRPEFDAV